MTAIGGPVESISVRGRNFAVAADADVNRSLGGFTPEVQSNGDGGARVILARVPWKLEGLTVSLDDDNADLEFLQEVADAGLFVAITITFASGVTYQGDGIVTGDLTGSTQSTTAAVSLSGRGKLTQQ